MENNPVISALPVSPQLRSWFAPVLAEGATWCAYNLDTNCAFLRVDGIELPLTVNSAQWENSWVCSPYTHYVSYAQEEVARAVHPAVAIPFSAMLAGLGHWFRSVQLNRVVMVNNWLMSTNPWPRWDARSLAVVIAALQDRWPEHTILFRSLNARECDPLLNKLRAVGARIIPSRQVWLFDPESVQVRRSRDLRKDISLLNRGDLQKVTHDELKEEDFSHLTELYENLYLHKYSKHNPRYSSKWLCHLWREGHLRFTGFRYPDAGWVGVEACGVIHGVMVSPIVGYDTRLARSLGVYRRLAVVPVLAARELGVPLNLSAGVGRFKELRGGAPVMEYIAVIDRHLPVERRLPWQFIEGMSRAVLGPVVRQLRL
jgi:hypothetical protein